MATKKPNSKSGITVKPKSKGLINSNPNKINDINSKPTVCYIIDDSEDQVPKSLKKTLSTFGIGNAQLIKPNTIINILNAGQKKLDFRANKYLIFLDINMTIDKCPEQFEDKPGFYIFDLMKKFPKLRICILTRYSVSDLGPFYTEEIRDKEDQGRWYLCKEGDMYELELAEILTKFKTFD